MAKPENFLEAFHQAHAGARQVLPFLLGALLLSGTAASAQQQEMRTTYRTEPIGQVLLPDVDPPDGSERTIGHEDIVLRGRIGYRTAATPAAPIDLVIADRPVRVSPGEMLLEMRVRGGSMASLPAARAFCLPPHESSNGPGRTRGYKQYCFVDQDNDGELDFALLTGKHLWDARVTVPFDAVPYSLRSDVPIPGAELRIVYQGRPVLGPKSLAIAVSLPGVSFDYVNRLRWRGEDGRMRGITYDRPVKNDTYPHIVSFGSARIEILAYDPEANTVRLRVLQGFARTDMEIVLETNGR